MALGKIGKALNKEKDKGRPAKTTPTDEARVKALAVGESILDLEDKLSDMETEASQLYSKLMATKLGQQLVEVQDAITDGKKRMKGLEAEALPLIVVVEPETMSLALSDGSTLTVVEKVGTASSANTKGSLEAFFGKPKAHEYWDQLEGKKTKYIALDRAEDD